MGTGAKFGPCGHEDDPTMEAFALEPGLQTIVWEESIYHFAAPARLALSYGGDDADSFEGCVLLDHIPHGDTGLPKNMSFTDESTYVRYGITVKIPDVSCDRCHLQLISAMTDFIHGVPPGTDCSLSGESLVLSGEKVACPAVYHSCAPVTIKGTNLSSSSSSSSSSVECDLAATDEELQWPFSDLNQQVGVYKFEGDEGNWTGNFPHVNMNMNMSLNDGRRAQAQGGPPPVYAQRVGPCADQAPAVV